jgi:hypothetical protein
LEQRGRDSRAVASLLPTQFYGPAECFRFDGSLGKTVIRRMLYMGNSR